MHNQPGIINSLLNIGVRGYIVKDDRKSIACLAEIIQSITQGDLYLSPQIEQILQYKFFPEVDFSDRQLEVLSLCASQPGTSLYHIADRLEMAPSTIRNILSNIYRTLGVSNRAAAIIKARQMGIITPDEPGSY
jgi:DNA-binding NarL/FixJ family response regulator